MNKHMTRIALSLLVAVLALEAVGSPRARAAEVVAAAQAGQIAGDTPKVIGREGWLMIRSQGRLDQVREQLRALGWKQPAERPDTLGGVDWSKSLVVGYYRFGDAEDTYTVGKCELTEGRVKLGILREYVVRQKPLEAKHVCNFVLVLIPAAKEVDVTISRRTGEEKAVPETVRRLATNSGDIVDGLTGSIRAEKDEVKAGEDIKVEFSLAWSDPWAGKEVEQKPAERPVYVWDGKYSEGYRNHGFLVQTPDGKSQFLRPAEVHGWDKNAPHPVEITKDKPYVLPGWVHGENWKSLKQLGLDTSKSGTYRITGVYMEQAGETDGMAGRKADGGKYQMWGGNIATNTIELVVK